MFKLYCPKNPKEFFVDGIIEPVGKAELLVELSKA